MITNNKSVNLEEVMSNFDNSIDKNIEQQLIENPRTHWARHSAYYFNGEVYYDGEQFVEDVWCDHIYIGTYKASTLKRLMEIVNEKYGRE